MEFSLCQLEPWLASYHAPIDTQAFAFEFLED